MRAYQFPQTEIERMTVVSRFGGGLVAQRPHLLPGGGNGPALFFKETGVVEQAAGRIEHGGEIGLAITIGVGK